jgi:Rieske Fe-S protein
MIGRRSLLLGTVGVLASCSNKQATDKLVPIAGPDQQPGEPLWSAKTNSFLVGLTDADKVALASLGAQYLAAGASGFVALANECTLTGSAKSTVGWCPSTGTFTCSVCGSHWSRVGAILQGPAKVGLTLLGVTVSADDDVIVNVRMRTPGRVVPGDQTSTLRNDLSCARIYEATTATR